MSTLFPTQDLISESSLMLSNSPYANELESVAPGITGLVDASAKNGESWIDSLTQLLPALAATYQQRQILQIQTDRARAGLPPLNASEYGLGLKVGLDSSTMKLALLGVVGLGALWYFTRKGR